MKVQLGARLAGLNYNQPLQLYAFKLGSSVDYEYQRNGIHTEALPGAPRLEPV